jgi:hypothetical protein
VIPLEHWSESRTLLAAELNEAEWGVVTDAIRKIGDLKLAFVLSITPPKAADELDETDRKVYERARDATLKANDVLTEFLQRSAPDTRRTHQKRLGVGRRSS